jgi:hypothetical protein
LEFRLDPTQNVPKQFNWYVGSERRRFVLIIVIGVCSLLKVRETIDVRVRLAVPSEITTRGLVVMKHEVGPLCRVNSRPPLGLQSSLIRIRTEYIRIEFGSDFPKSTILIPISRSDPHCGMALYRSSEFGQRSMTDHCRGFVSRAI